MKRALLAWCAAVVLQAATGPAARAVDQEAIDKAVERGVAFLRNAQQNQDLPMLGQSTGASALAGLTLLECGVAPDDKTVQRIAEAVRPASVTQDQTYSLALGILFLDRLGDPADAPLIESMTVRLLAGQNPASGGWSYSCPDISDAEVRRLNEHLKRQAELVGRRDPVKDKDGKPIRPSVKDLPREIQEQLAQVGRMASPPDGGVLGDNSNTQFATIALWVARRHGLPVETALARISQRYRNSQNADGGWGYMPAFSPGQGMPGVTPSSATMTCAGLLGLVVAQGAVAESDLEKGKAAPDPGKDRALKAGLLALGTTVGAPTGKIRSDVTAAGKTFYYFWSLERVAVALDLDTVGGKDWYGWGSEILLANQMNDGSWQGEYPGIPDTCFSLLFLKRANLARDLTANLKGKLQDPGSVTLKSGGVGGEALKSGLEDKKPPHDAPASAGKTPKDPAGTRPPAAEETDGARLARELLQTPAGRREQMLETYRDGKGVTYTEALAGAIPQLTGEDRGKARDALAERLTRMKAETLGRYFQDGDAEIRRAAALATAMKESKTLIPDLVPLLADAEPSVARAAHAALKDLAGEDAGPSVEDWRAWWKKKQEAK